ncbi:hypothetical protein A2U01_0063282, partial [Trifolium medium]|nr:hypothetical protein [Trifolium medium]
MLHPCFSSGQLFVNDQTLSVSPAETAIIKDLGAASRKKVLAEDVAALVRLAEMALVLNEEGSSSEREIVKLRARNESLSARVTKLEADLHDREE